MVLFMSIKEFKSEKDSEKIFQLKIRKGTHTKAKHRISKWPTHIQNTCSKRECRSKAN